MASGNALGGTVAERVAPAAFPRLTLTVSEAAACLGVSLDFFAEHIAPYLRIIRVGRKKLVPVDELLRWVDDNAERPVEADR